MYSQTDSAQETVLGASWVQHASMVCDVLKINTKPLQYQIFSQLNHLFMLKFESFPVENTSWIKAISNGLFGFFVK